jgi:hypothetical protein
MPISISTALLLHPDTRDARPREAARRRGSLWTLEHVSLTVPPERDPVQRFVVICSTGPRRMIIITGLGRSGTSAVARLYQELGFDPGGAWFPEMNAGLEDHAIVRLNEGVVKGLGIGVPERELPAAWERIPESIRRAGRRRFQILHETFSLRPEVRWERFDSTVGRYGPALREAARTRPVAKDPRFAWTLGVWAAAGAVLDHVVLCMRDLDAVVRSRVRVGRDDPQRATRSKNALIYKLGLCLSAIHEWRLPHSVLRFPDFVNDPEGLYRTLPFPEPVTEEAFRAAFDHVIHRDQVHDWQ